MIRHWLATLAISSFLMPAMVCSAEDLTVTVDIPAQPLRFALNQLAQQANIEVVFYTDLGRDIVAKPLEGKLTPEAALQQLLEGSGLSYEFIAERTVAILKPKKVTDSQESSEEAGSDDGLAEVVVSAQRREETLQSVPIAATAFSGNDLATSKIEDVGDYFDRTPNVNFTDNGGQRQARTISMRGITSLAGVSTTFGFYVDDFNIASTTVNPSLHDVQRVEVLRGPQPTYFGRNAIGGAVNIVTNKPAPNFYSKVGVGYARFNTYNIDGVVNVPVSDKFFLRASASWEESDGVVRNVNPVGGRSAHEYLNARLGARWLLTDLLTLDVTYDHVDERQDIREEVPTGIPDPSLLGVYYTEPDLTGTGAWPQNQNKVNLDRPDRSNEDIDIVNAKLAYESDSVTITSITGFIRRVRAQDSDLDFSRFDVVSADEPYHYRDISQEVRIQSAGDRKLSWSTGATYAKFNGDLDQDVFAGTDFLGGLFAGLNISDYHKRDNTKAWSAFAELGYKLTDKLSLTAGGRYTDEESESLIDFISFFDDVSVPLTTTRTKDFSPRVAASYEFSEGITGYATAAKGFKAGGVQPSTLLAPTYDKETLWNYEVGLKGFVLDKRLRFSLAVYDMQWKDLQVSARRDVVDPDTGQIDFLFATSNAAEASSKGVELELTAVPWRRGEVSVAAGYNDAKFNDFRGAVVADAPAVLVSPEGTVDLSGKPIPLSTKRNLSASVQQKFTVRNDMDGYVRGEYLYRSSYYADTTDLISTNPYYAQIPGRSVVNVRTGVDWNGFGISMFAENVFDKEWYTGSFDNFSFSGRLVTPHPRTYGLRVQKEFR